MKKLCLFFIIITLSCQSKTCEIDVDFKERYFNAIKIVEKFSKGYPVRFVYRVSAVECLEAVTGHAMKIEKDGDSPYFYIYDEKRDYLDEDIKFWNEWYQNNKCHFTTQIADSLINTRKEVIDGLTWPPNFEIVKKDTLSY